MLQGVFKSGLIAILLLCSMSAALFGSGCSMGLFDAPAYTAQTCAMTLLEASALPVETTEHASVLVVQSLAIVSVLLAVFLLAIELPRFLHREAFLDRQRRLRWIWARAFGNYFTHSISIPYLRATRDA